MPDTLCVGCGKQSKRSGRINKVHRIWDLWWRPIDQLAADCLRHSEVPMGIITKSELRQNYCITEDKLRHFTLTITVAPFQRLMCVDEVIQHCLVMERVTFFCWFKCCETKLPLKESINHQSWKDNFLFGSLLNIKHTCQTCNNRPMLHNMHNLIFVLWCFVDFCHSLSIHL